MDESLPGSGRFAFPALVTANLFLAFGPWLVRDADVGPIAAGFWRIALAVPVLFVLAHLSRRRTGASGQGGRLTLGMVAALALAGLFFALDLASWHSGIHLTKLANATLFGNASSLLFPLYGFIIARSWPRPLHAGALLLAILGVGLLLGRSYELSPRHLTGDLLALLAGTFYTFYLIVIDRTRRTIAPMPVLALTTAAGAVPLLLMAMLAGEQIMPHDWTPLILLSLGSQLLGQGLLVYAIGHVGPLLVGVTFLTQPIVNGLLGAIAYDERLGAGDIVGALLICVAMVLIRMPTRLERRATDAHLAREGDAT